MASWLALSKNFAMDPRALSDAAQESANATDPDVESGNPTYAGTPVASSPSSLGNSTFHEQTSSRALLISMPIEILQKIGTYLSAKEIAALASTSSTLHKACRHQMYRGWWDLSAQTPIHRLFAWSNSRDFLYYARAFKLDLARSCKTSVSSPNAEVVGPASLLGQAHEAVARILQGAHEVSCLQLSSTRFRNSSPRNCITSAIEEALQRCRGVKELHISGFWNAEIYQILDGLLPNFTELQELHIHGLDLESLEPSRAFFKYVFQGFSGLRSLSMSLYFDDAQIPLALEEAVLAAPARNYTALAVIPSSFREMSNQVAFAEEEERALSEAKIIASLLGIQQAHDPARICRTLGVNIRTLARLAQTYDLSGVTSLSISYPMEVTPLGFIHTGNYWKALPDAFIYSNKVSTLELKTIIPEGVIMELAIPEAHGHPSGAAPFPLLRVIRASLPDWSCHELDLRGFRKKGARLRSSLKYRGIALEWGYVDI